MRKSTFFCLFYDFYVFSRVYHPEGIILFTPKSTGKNLYEKILTKTCDIMDALHSSTREDFRSTSYLDELVGATLIRPMIKNG